jgi:hypothetical protein
MSGKRVICGIKFFPSAIEEGTWVSHYTDITLRMNEHPSGNSVWYIVTTDVGGWKLSTIGTASAEAAVRLALRGM